MKTKMVIIIRKDLNMRKGKMIAQAAHAVEMLLCNVLTYINLEDKGLLEASDKTQYYWSWKGSGRKKIVVSVDSEKELLEVHRKAVEGHVPASLVTDAGITEFHGTSTKTAVAIGPWDEDMIDKITGSLRLL
jgi:PTH2 family peptidyl-tRNA hydrolase